MKQGFVYLMKASTGHYKIGMSRNVRQRLKAFSVEMPIHVRLIHAFPVDDTSAAERALHELYADLRQAGEWFNLTQNEVDYIYSINAYVGGIFVRIPASGTENDENRFLSSIERLNAYSEVHEITSIDGVGERLIYDGPYQDRSEVEIEFYTILKLVEPEVNVQDVSARVDAAFESLRHSDQISATTYITINM